MQKLLRPVSENSKWLLIFLFLIFVSIESAAGAITPVAIAEKETEAARLSLEWNAASIRRSVELYSEAGADWELFNEPHNAARCLREEAMLLMTIYADYKSASAKLEKALRLDRQANFTEGRIITLSHLSRLAYLAGETQKSEKYYKEAMLLSDAADSPSAKASALFAAAEYNLFFGDINETIVFYDKALESAEKAGDKKLMSQILVNLGFAHLRQGDSFTGLEKERRALEKADETGDRRAQAVALNGLGSLYVFLDEKRTALEIFQRAEAMYPEDLDQLEKGKLLNGIATIYEDYNEVELAENYRRQAFNLFGKASYPYGQLATLPSLARLKWMKGDRASGKRMYDESLALAAQLKSEFHVAIVREDLGGFDFKDGAFDAAIGNYRAAQAVYDKLKIELPRLQTKLGEAYAAKNDFRAAREYFLAALETNRRTMDALPAAENLYHLARLDQSEGQTQPALERIRESVAITESLYRNAANNRLGSSFISNIYDRYELYINLLMKMQRESGDAKFALEALQAAEKSRARVMLENLALAEADFTKDADAETVRREKEIRVLLNAKSDKLTDLLSRRAERTETDKVSVEIAELEHELADIKTRLREQSPIYSAIRNPAPFDAADFQKNVLDDDSLLIEFSLGDAESYLWTIERGGIGFFVLPPRREIAAHIENLRELIKAHEPRNDETVEIFQKRIADAESAYRFEAAELSRKLFGQIAGKFANKRLIVVPDAELHYFPVAALPLPDASSDAPILSTNEVVTEPSAQTLAVIAQSRRQRAPKNLLVFSDPIFTLDDARLIGANETSAKTATESVRSERFRFIESLDNLPRLPASKDESDSITRIVGAGQAENFTGFSATRENLLNLKTSDYRIVHFATHGLTNETRPELSGVALSAFDENGQKLNQLFRIQDIYALNLNADLVVLSACATGSGKHVKGEGLMSLNNAFLQSGAKTVVASLWKVEDGATLELMKHFYGAMADEDLTPAQALRRAQLKLRENPRYRSPFFWAAFTAQGDFRSVPQMSGGYGFWIYLFPAASLGLFGIYLYRRRNSAVERKDWKV